METTEKRLRAWVDLLSADHIARGKVWYGNANLFAQTVAERYNIPLNRVVGVLSVLSVQNRWNSNKRDCERLIRAFREGIALDTVSVGTYSLQKDKAIAILQGMDVHVNIGTKYACKTHAFYDNIMYPSASKRATIDRWIFRGLDLEYLTNGGGNRYIAAYHRIEKLFVAVAAEQRMRPHELQAAVWCCIQETAAAENWIGSRPGTGVSDDFKILLE